MESIQLVLMNIYQSNTYKEDLNWLYCSDDQQVQVKQQVKGQQYQIPVF